MTQRRMEFGFDLAVDNGDAEREAITRWYEAATRADQRVAGEPTAIIVHSPKLRRIGQYVVEVTGEVTDDGDQ